jgi:hypothetical protein
MRVQHLDTIWRRPEGLWVKPEQLAESMGVDTAHVHELTRRGLLTRRPGDGALLVEGCDSPSHRSRATTTESATIESVALLLQGVRRDLQAVHARIDHAVESEVNRVFAETLNAAPPPVPKTAGQESRWFAFPFGISL